MSDTCYVGYIIYSRRNATSSSAAKQDGGTCTSASDEEVNQGGVKGVSMEGQASDVNAFRDTETGLPTKGASKLQTRTSRAQAEL
jgi:hypothetical protein